MVKSFHARASVVLALACSWISPLGAQQARDSRVVPVHPQVLILGTYHMGGSGDYIQTTADDVLSPRRQREIELLVDALAAFRPTKIMVEAPLTRDSSLNVRYRKYAAGQDTLRRNEIDQIGFRLAKRLDLRRVYGIDYLQDEESSAWWGGRPSTATPDSSTRSSVTGHGCRRLATACPNSRSPSTCAG